MTIITKTMYINIIYHVWKVSYVDFVPTNAPHDMGHLYLCVLHIGLATKLLLLNTSVVLIFPVRVWMPGGLWIDIYSHQKGSNDIPRCMFHWSILSLYMESVSLCCYSLCYFREESWYTVSLIILLCLVNFPYSSVLRVSLLSPGAHNLIQVIHLKNRML